MNSRSTANTARSGRAYSGTPGMDGNLNSMTTGSVDVSRVRVHHDLWMQEREATGLDVAEAPRTQPEAARGKTVSEHPA